MSNLNDSRRSVWLLTVTWNSSRDLFCLEQEESESKRMTLLYYLLIMQTVVNHHETNLRLTEISQGICSYEHYYWIFNLRSTDKSFCTCAALVACRQEFHRVYPISVILKILDRKVYLHYCEKEVVFLIVLLSGDTWLKLSLLMLSHGMPLRFQIGVCCPVTDFSGILY